MAQASNAGTEEQQRRQRAEWLTKISVIVTGLSLILSAISAYHARDAAVRQLRAYLFVESSTGLKPVIVAGAPFKIQITFRNYGQTPALHVKHNAWVRLDAWPPSNNKWTAPLDIEKGTEMSLPQSQPGYIQTRYPTTFTPEQVAQIGSGAMRIIVFGQITYEDVFGHQRYSYFCFASTRPEVGFRMSWQRCPEHNEAE